MTVHDHSLEIILAGKDLQALQEDGLDRLVAGETHIQVYQNRCTFYELIAPILGDVRQRRCVFSLHCQNGGYKEEMRVGDKYCATDEIGLRITHDHEFETQSHPGQMGMDHILRLLKEYLESSEKHHSNMLQQNIFEVVRRLGMQYKTTHLVGIVFSAYGFVLEFVPKNYNLFHLSVNLTISSINTNNSQALGVTDMPSQLVTIH